VACQKDDIAWGLYRACGERGLTVGRDVAVTGFDDHPHIAQLDPPLTTVRQPFREKGWQAARLLDRAMSDGFHAPVQVTLGVELVLRGSA
jgi:LacI family transcriptional regulator